MEPLIIQPTEDTPKIVLDLQNGTFEISGRSLPEDVSEFYQPVFDKFSNLSSTSVPRLDLDFKLDYYNTASSKLFLEMFSRLEEINKTGCHVCVKWHYDYRDKEMLEAGEEYAEHIDIEFEMIKF